MKAAAIIWVIWLGASLTTALAVEPLNVGVIDSPEAAVANVLRAVEEGRRNDAFAACSRLIASDAFAMLGTQRQRSILALAYSLARNLEDKTAAVEYARRATMIDGATGEDWQRRAISAMEAGDFADAAVSLTTIAKKWPRQLSTFPARVVGMTLDRVLSLDDADDAHGLLVALDGAGWLAVQDHDMASKYRYQLVLLALDRGNTAYATTLAKQVRGVRELIMMRADGRFDAIVKRNRDQFDIGRAVQREISEYRRALSRRPRSLRALVDLCRSMRVNRESAEVMSLVDEALTKWRSSSRERAFDDIEHIIWIMNMRSDLLVDLGRWDEAARQLSEAVMLPEQTKPNISQVLNLARLYVSLDRHQDARALLVSHDYLAGASSPYGRAVLEGIRYSIARKMNDSGELQRAREYIVKHKDDAKLTYEHMLAEEGLLDEVAALTIAALENPRTRGTALARSQGFADRPFRTPGDEERSRFYDALYARADIRSTVDRYGKIEYYDIYGFIGF